MRPSFEPSARRLRQWIGGREVEAAGEFLDVINPATGRAIAAVPSGSAAEVDQAVAAGRSAFAAWSRTPMAERAAIVGGIADGLSARQEEIAATITAEMGSPITFARKVQVRMAVNAAAGTAAVAPEADRTEEIGNSLVLSEPVGVVGAITPWHYPLYQMVAKVAPALVAGCTVVLKPSEIAPLTAATLAEVCTAAGLPAGVLNVVHGTGPVVGAAIAVHPDVDTVSFTGSTAAGKAVAAAAAGTVKRVTLELGGNSANVVLPEADLAVAVKLGVANCFLNGGQTCTAWSRMIVPAARHDEALALAAGAAAKYIVGDPTDPATRIGPMASTAQQRRVLGYIERGIAELVCGGPGPVAGLDGAYVAPTIFGGVRSDWVIAQEEIFGPVLAVLPYDTEDEAVAIANSTVYGLAGAVFGEPARAMAVARRLRAGQVAINGGAFNIAAPFGGTGSPESGANSGATASRSSRR